MNKNKNVKENPIMVEQKVGKNIKIKNTSNDDNEIKTFAIIVVVIAILIAIIYGVTEILKKDKTTEQGTVTGVVDYDKISVGTMLNRPYDSYYVLAYDADDNKAVLYSTILTKYMQNSENEDYIKIYYCDLGNNLNNKYYDVNNDEKSNPNAKVVEEFDFGSLTLLKIEKGKITKYIEDYEEIKEILK